MSNNYFEYITEVWSKSERQRIACIINLPNHFPTDSDEWDSDMWVFITENAEEYAMRLTAIEGADNWLVRLDTMRKTATSTSMYLRSRVCASACYRDLSDKYVIKEQPIPFADEPVAEPDPELWDVFIHHMFGGKRMTTYTITVTTDSLSKVDRLIQSVPWLVNGGYFPHVEALGQSDDETFGFDINLDNFVVLGDK